VGGYRAPGPETRPAHGDERVTCQRADRRVDRCGLRGVFVRKPRPRRNPAGAAVVRNLDGRARAGRGGCTVEHHGVCHGIVHAAHHGCAVQADLRDVSN
jgi:hypothetical protein